MRSSLKILGTGPLISSTCLYRISASILKLRVWALSLNESFNFSALFEQIRRRNDEVQWHSIVWFPGCTPRHSFILWLAIWGKLNTKYRALCWGKVIDTTCPLCHLACKTVEHLYFDCIFTRRIWRVGLRKCYINLDLLQLDCIIAYVSPGSHQNHLKAFILKNLLATSVYFIWQERNRRVFSGQFHAEEVIFNNIISYTKFKLSCCKKKFASNTINKKLCVSWEQKDSLLV